MEGNGKQILKSSKKINKGLLIGYLICIGIIIAAAVIMNYRIEKETPEAIDFTTEGAIGMPENKYAYIDIEALSTETGIYGDTTNENDYSNDRYYLAINKGYFYVIDLNFELIDQLKPLQDYMYSTAENAVAPEPQRIYGMTENAPKELKEMIINYYNELFGEEYAITVDDFENYFGSVILNARREPVDTEIESLTIILALIFFVVVVVSHIILKFNNKKIEKYLQRNGYKEDLENQLDDFVEEKYYKDKVIFTKDYIVDVRKRLVAIKYSDIKWIYIHNMKSYGITVSSSIIACLNDGKTKIQFLEINQKASDEFMEVFNKLCEKIPADSLKGYTAENITEYKEFKRGI